MYSKWLIIVRQKCINYTDTHKYIYMYTWICVYEYIHKNVSYHIYIFVCVYKVYLQVYWDLQLGRSRHIRLHWAVIGRPCDAMGYQKERVATKTAIHITDGNIFRSTSSRDLSFPTIPSVPLGPLHRASVIHWSNVNPFALWHYIWRSVEFHVMPWAIGMWF